MILAMHKSQYLFDQVAAVFSTAEHVPHQPLIYHLFVSLLEVWVRSCLFHLILKNDHMTITQPYNIQTYSPHWGQHCPGGMAVPTPGAHSGSAHNTVC